MANDPLEYVQVEVLTAARDQLDYRWRSDNGVAPYTRLYLVEEGEAWLAPVAGRVVLHPGMLAVIPAGTAYAFGCPQRWTVSWVHLRATIGGGMDFFRAFGGVLALPLQTPARVLRLFTQLRVAYQGTQAGRLLTVRGLTLQLLGGYLDAVPQQMRGALPVQQERFLPVLQRIEQDFALPLRIPELAALAHYETASFAVRFKKVFGCTPGEMLRQRRLAAAQKALLLTTHTLERIAADCGFSDAFHLSKTFKKHTGQSPNAYRQSANIIP